MAVERRSSDEIRRLAVEQGLRSLRQDGVEKVLNGVTSLEEVLRIVEGRSEDTGPEPEPVEIVAENAEAEEAKRVVPLRRGVS